ncbi:MAG: extracellular solute-binding protein, partial [Planctomycetes bacterium]|nr:extracellular solute-binding protein [Planctomycetota bacterium]
VLYCSVDERFAREVISHYEKKTGASVQLVTDSEAGKTTGLVNRIRAEGERPRANVFWSSELSQTILLAREGLLAPYNSPNAVDIPTEFRDPKNMWTGFALRARVLAYDPKVTRRSEVPTRWEDLSKPEVAAHLAIANPLFGTTRSHVAAMLALWGPERFTSYLDDMVEHGVLVTQGNSSAVRRLIEGSVKFAATDSDDVLVATRRGHLVDMVFAEFDGQGAFVIPNTVALLAGSEENTEAKRLVDYILSQEVERMLAQSDSRNFPVRAKLSKELRMRAPKASLVSPDAVADAMPEAVRICREAFLK